MRNSCAQVHHHLFTQHWREQNKFFANNLILIYNAQLNTLIQTGFTNNLPGLSIVVFKNEDEADEEIQINYDSNQRIKQYNLQFVRYIQYVRIKYVGDSDGILLGEVEVHGFCKYEISYQNHAVL